MEKLDELHITLKRQVGKLRQTIRLSEKQLEFIREKECKHPQTETVNYQWAVGHIMPDTEVCVVCGKVILNNINKK